MPFPVPATKDALGRTIRTAGRYRKRPAVVEAYPWVQGQSEHQVAYWPDWLVWAQNTSASEEGAFFTQSGEGPFVHALGGVVKVEDGDWIVKGVNGEIYPCKPDIFAQTYEHE